MKNRIFILFAVGMLSVSSCSDWLSVTPRTEESADKIFKTLDGYQTVLIGCYTKLKNQSLYGRDLTVTTTEYLAQHWDTDESAGDGLSTTVNAVKAYRYDDDNVKTSIKNIYSKMYNVIVQTNSILEALPKTGETAIKDKKMRAIIEAEARAIRAYCHFDILRLFGRVPGGSTQVTLPYSEEVSYNSAKYYSFDEFANKIEYDLNEAEKLLEEHDPFIGFTVTQVNGMGGVPREEVDFYRYRQLRLNYFAVKALQARFYLYIGGRDGDALAAARTVIKAAQSGKGFALAGTTNMNAGYFALPGEGLFMLSNNQIKGQMTTYFPGYSTSPTTRTGLYMSPEKLIEMFGMPLSASAGNRFNKLWNHNKLNSLNKSCPELLKYYQGDDSGKSATELLLYKQIVPMLRLSELYLIVIELSNDAAEVRSLYKDYRRARDFNDPDDSYTMEEVKGVIEAEYRREFFGEGQMFFYYKRKFSTKMMWSNKVMVENNYIVPLPDTESDPNL